jgi:hypothetical protein
MIEIPSCYEKLIHRLVGAKIADQVHREFDAGGKGRAGAGRDRFTDAIGGSPAHHE